MFKIQIDQQSFSLASGELFLVGRGEKCDILLDDPSASRVHCRLLARDGTDWWHSHDFAAEVNRKLTFWHRLDDFSVAFPHFAEAVAPRKGHIGLQLFEGTIEYRNIRIQPLKQD